MNPDPIDTHFLFKGYNFSSFVFYVSSYCHDYFFVTYIVVCTILLLLYNYCILPLMFCASQVPAIIVFFVTYLLIVVWSYCSTTITIYHSLLLPLPIYSPRNEGNDERLVCVFSVFPSGFLSIVCYLLSFLLLFSAS